MPALDVKISQRQIDLWSKKQARSLMKIIKTDAILLAQAGIGPNGGQYAPYKSEGLEGEPVTLTGDDNLMLEEMKIRIKKSTGFIKPGAYYGRFQNGGTLKGKRFRRKKDAGARLIGGKRGRRVEGADLNAGHIAIPARPFMVLRPVTQRKIQRWLEFTLDRSFNAKSLRDTFNTGGLF